MTSGIAVRAWIRVSLSLQLLAAVQPGFGGIAFPAAGTVPPSPDLVLPYLQRLATALSPKAEIVSSFGLL
jgi:hypothetical protein